MESGNENDTISGVPELQDSYGQATAAMLERLSAEIGLVIPSEYQQFLKIHNGGNFSNLVVYRKDREGLAVEGFYAVDAPYDFDDLGKACKNHSECVSAGYLPIGNDGMGNQICLRLTSESAPVCVWDHEVDRYRVISNSLRDFMEHLVYEDGIWYQTHQPFVAAERGIVAYVEDLPDSDIGVVNEDGYDLLCVACMSRQPRVVRVLLAKGAQVDVEGPDGRSPLMLAARSGALDACRLLVEHGADLNKRDIEGRNALMNAIAAGHVRVSEYLIDCGTVLGVTDSYGETAYSLGQCLGTTGRKHILPRLR